jgi:MOSC domain-containing protein YiiM
MQITIMNSRIVDLLAGDRARWPLAGDQLYVDMDIGDDNMPVGQQFTIGEALLEITEIPHTGCAKFTERYGSAAIRFVNSPEGRAARRRGVYARVIKPGRISTGDLMQKTG